MHIRSSAHLRHAKIEQLHRWHLQRATPIGKRGAAIRDAGTQARYALQDFFRERIHLDLRVAVAKEHEWCTRRLASLAYVATLVGTLVHTTCVIKTRRREQYERLVHSLRAQGIAASGGKDPLPPVFALVRPRDPPHPSWPAA